MIRKYVFVTLLLCASFSRSEDAIIDEHIDLTCKGLVNSAVAKVNAANSSPRCAPQQVQDPPVFETCTNTNKYLEAKLPAIDKNSIARTETSVDSLCIARAQLHFPSPGYSGLCKGPEAFPKGGQEKPCITERYTNFVQKSFSDVMKCFQIPEDQIFPIFALESGFQVNSLGKNMDAGISQLTGPLIAAINHTYFQQAKEKAVSSSNCSSIISNFKMISANPNVRCEAMTPPENPTKSFVYAAILYNSNKQVIQAGIAKLKKMLPKDLDSRALEQALTILSFNVAPGSINLVLSQYVRSRGQNIQANDFKINARTQNDFYSFIAKNFPVSETDSPERKEKISIYIPLALNMSSHIEQTVGVGNKCISSSLKNLF